jgi:hypothetical protein
MHWTENLKQIFPEMKLRSLVTKICIPVYVSDLYIATIGLQMQYRKNRQTDRGNIYIAHRYINVEIGNKTTQCHFWEYFFRIFGTVQPPCTQLAIYLPCHITVFERKPFK